VERHEALSLRLTQKVYTINEHNDLKTLYVVTLVYRGDEIRVVCSSNLEDWTISNVYFYQDVFTSKTPLWKTIKAQMVAERDALQCKIDQVTEEIE